MICKIKPARNAKATLWGGLFIAGGCGCFGALSRCVSVKVVVLDV
jgi:hypothetical protein